MTKNFEICPICGIGNIVSEIITESSLGEFYEKYQYSCGHKHSNLQVPTFGAVGDITALSTKHTSENETGCNPKFEILERWKKDDQDNPNQPVLNIYYKNRKVIPTSIFQVIKYVSGEIKHVHCKTCDLEYKYNSGDNLEDLFFISFQSGVKIECLCCHAGFEQLF